MCNREREAGPSLCSDDNFKRMAVSKLSEEDGFAFEGDGELGVDRGDDLGF